MKVYTILSIVAMIATPAIASPKRKRVFKIYTSEEIQLMDRNLKKEDKPKKGEEMSMLSMPSGMPSIPSDETEMLSMGSTVPGMSMGTTVPVEEVTPSPMRSISTTPSPTVSSDPTMAPVTPAPITPAPVTPAPTTPSPTTPSPTTPSPISPSPTTPSPVTPSPTTPAPVEVEEVTAPPVPVGTPPTSGVVGIDEPAAPSGAMTLGTTLAVMAVACVMIFI